MNEMLQMEAHILPGSFADGNAAGRARVILALREALLKAGCHDIEVDAEWQGNGADNIRMKGWQGEGARYLLEHIKETAAGG
jgi:hypothetical protein